MSTITPRLMQVVKFYVGGAIGVAVYFAALYSLTEYLGVWYVLSAVIGFILNVGVTFTLQKFWTFQSKEAHMINRQVTAYFSVAVCFLACNTAFLYIAVEYLRLWYIVAQVISTAIISLVSFFTSSSIFRADSTGKPIRAASSRGARTS